MNLSGEGGLATRARPVGPCTSGQVSSDGPQSAGSGQLSFLVRLGLPTKLGRLDKTGPGVLTGKKGRLEAMSDHEGDILVAELTRELWVYSTHGRCVDQKAGKREATHCNEDSRSWFSRSVWPLDCG